MSHKIPLVIDLPVEAFDQLIEEAERRHTTLDTLTILAIQDFLRRSASVPPQADPPYSYSYLLKASNN